MPHHVPSLSTIASIQSNNKALAIRKVSVLFILILKLPFVLFALQTEYMCQSEKGKQTLTELAYFQYCMWNVGVRDKDSSREI